MSTKLTFDELSRLIAEDLDLPRQKIRAFTHELVNIIQAGLINDGKVNLSKLGKFELKHVEAREGRDPKTGDPITIPAHNKVVFKPYKKVRERINAPYEELEATFVEETGESAKSILHEEQAGQESQPLSSSEKSAGTTGTEHQPASPQTHEQSATTQTTEPTEKPDQANHFNTADIKKIVPRIMAIVGFSTFIIWVGVKSYRFFRDNEQ